MIEPLKAWRITASGDSSDGPAAMDVTFNVQNHMYALAGASDAMKAEIAINIATAVLAVWTIAACWPRRIAG